MESGFYSLRAGDYRLEVNYLAGIMGYDGKEPDPVSHLVSECLEEVAGLEVRSEYRLFRDAGIDFKGGRIRVAGEEFRTGRIIASQLKRVKSVAIMLATAGDEITLLSRSYSSSGDPLKAYIMDVIGSELTEAAADRLHRQLQSRMNEEGAGVTNRFSPGYCGWQVEEQQLIFRIFDNNRCRITLNESFLMSPVKSVSGIIGIGEGARIMPYSCNRCESSECIYRGRRVSV